MSYIDQDWSLYVIVYRFYQISTDILLGKMSIYKKGVSRRKELTE